MTLCLAVVKLSHIATFLTVFCPILTKVGTHDLCANQYEKSFGTDFRNFALIFFTSEAELTFYRCEQSKLPHFRNTLYNVGLYASIILPTLAVRRVVDGRCRTFWTR